MYRVLYRKWRPKSFDEVVGQEHITETLTNEVQSGKIAHAYLFTGVRGTGKTTCAKILAKAINCLNPINGNPCGECEACKSIEEETAMDIMEIDAAGNNGVENIRNIIDETAFTPVSLKKRVYIIDEVHMLSIGAFNAFLKTLEEPSEYVVFILATTEINKIPATILSRCQRFDFYRIPIQKMSERLLYIAGQENIILDEAAANLVSKLSNGALRDALSILERCIMNVNQEATSDTVHITLDTVNDTVGTVGKEALEKFVEFILKKDTENTLKQLEQFYIKSKSMSGLLNELLEYFRDIMVLKSVRSTKNILEYSERDIDRLAELSKNISLTEILAMMDILEKSCTVLKKNIDSKASVEMALIKLCNIEPKGAVRENNSELVYRIEKLEREIKILKDSNVRDTKAINKDTPKKTAEKVAIGEELNIDKLIAEAQPLDLWTDVVKEIQQTSPAMAVAFSDSKAFVNQQYLFIDTKNEFAFTLLRQSNKRNEIRKIIENITGKTYKLGPYRKVSLPEKESTDELDVLVEKVKKLEIPFDVT